VRLHRLLGSVGIALRNGERHLLMFRIALPQAFGWTLSCRTQVQPRITPDLPKERVKVRSQTVAGGGRDCIMEIEIGACALLFGQCG
jgi:hypothetical protein